MAQPAALVEWAAWVAGWDSEPHGDFHMAKPSDLFNKSGAGAPLGGAKPSLSLNLNPNASNKRKDKKGVLVDSVRQGGPVSQAKPQMQVGDVIVRVGNKSSIGVRFIVDVDKPKPSLAAISPSSFSVAGESL